MHRPSKEMENALNRRTFAVRLLRTCARALLLSACLLPAGCATMHRLTAPKPFTLIVLPDTQRYTQMYPNIFARQTAWIKEQKKLRNIVGVLHEGDITDKSTEEEWSTADQSMRTLDGVVPYYLVMGNHDFDPDSTPAQRGASRFNQHFGSQRFAKYPWYGGHYGAGNENAYYLLRVEKSEFLILCLEFGPRDDVLAWANQIVAAHPNHHTILFTHCYTSAHDTRIGPKDPGNPRGMGYDGNDGEQIWQKFASRHKNIFLVLSGHILGDGLGHLISQGINGNRVDQILANYQMQKFGGTGWLRILNFHPDQQKISIKTYSPMLEKYAHGQQNQFEIDYPR